MPCSVCFGLGGELKPVQIFSVPSNYSDHAMVVGDFAVQRD
jgi:hypothetical protein